MKNDPKFVGDSNSSLKLLIFQLINVRELETIEYAFGVAYQGYIRGIASYVDEMNSHRLFMNMRAGVVFSLSRGTQTLHI